jgi:predicted PurR-regulated permease PerM
MSDDQAASTTRNAVVFLAAAAGGTVLWVLRGILTPFVLAVFLMVLMDGLAGLIDRRLRFVPTKAAMPLALLVCLIAFGGTVYLLVDNLRTFLGQIADFGPKLQGLLDRIAQAMGVKSPPSLNNLAAGVDPGRLLGTAALSAQAIISDAVFVLIYLGFLIASSQSFRRKIVTLFPTHERRESAVQIFSRISGSIERYVWVQTVTGLMMAAGAWALMALIGLDSALFWAFFVFISSYVPMIGAAVALVAPTLFALVQFDTYWQALVLLVGLESIFFLVGNLVLPRMQGQSLNLDPVVLLLSLGFWSAIWGLPGAFLSSPLTVMVMIILAQFPSTYWIAVLLSDDGEPGLVSHPHGHHAG